MPNFEHISELPSFLQTFPDVFNHPNLQYKHVKNILVEKIGHDLDLEHDLGYLFFSLIELRCG